MIPRWSVIATIADSSSANLMSASSFCERSSASLGVSSASTDLAVIWKLRLGTGDLRFFEFLQTVSKLVARDAQELGGACLITTASLDRLPDKREFSFVERNSCFRQHESCRSFAVFAWGRRFRRRQ